MRTVAALCVARNSVYKTLPGVECFDVDRDARTFQGGMPIVAHPPCRAWSKFCRHQAKPEPGEKELGLWCAEQLRQWGGVLEQPAGSYLFDAAQLPRPRERDVGSGLFTLEVWQAWWGYNQRKATWLCFAGMHPDTISMPFTLHQRGQDRRRQQAMSKNGRSATTEYFARWLVAVARLSNLCSPNTSADS